MFYNSAMIQPHEIDWDNLGFAYVQTRSHIRYTYRDGAWDSGELHSDPYLNLHIGATALHYGQAAFEGLKAFTCADGEIRIFRPDENAKRLGRTADRVLMADVPEDLFLEAVHRVVRDNADYVPPYGTGGSLYIRPLLFGSGPRIGVQPAAEYTFLVLVMPVGDYYKGGLSPVGAIVLDGYDRAAPQGVGHAKVAGNYAASLVPSKIAKAQGYSINLYLDSRENRYVDEFGTSNFVGITHDGAYVTPDSPSILPSITNMSLMTLAEDLGLRIERRAVDFCELAEFAEIGACGTAVVVTPINRIVRNDEIIEVGPADSCGPTLQKLYSQVRGIQLGELPDPRNWNQLLR